MDCYLHNFSTLKKKIAATSYISKDLICETIKNFVLCETKTFTIMESKSFLTLLKILLKCKRDNVIISKADALQTVFWNELMKWKLSFKKSIQKQCYCTYVIEYMYSSKPIFFFGYNHTFCWYTLDSFWQTFGIFVHN